MAIPVYLQQFKAAGVYRVVFDKSTVLGVNSEILRLVVGYSEKGPFNIPTYVTSISEFKAIYGDISKKLEKRGVFFHRLALQALASGPILALNLKKFDGETVDGASINTDFNPSFDAIETVKLNVEDIYDTSRFWELSANELNNLRGVDGGIMDQYINICTTNTKNTSGTYFIRKASGQKVSGYKISVSDWYSDNNADMPEYLEKYKNSLVSDFFAEIYVFNGRFTTSQVLASSTLKNYFEMAVDKDGKQLLDDNGEKQLKLRPYLTNAYGDHVDTLDALYNDSTSGALGHYIGALIPNFKTKSGQYVSLDILFNTEQDIHNMMMSFNVDLLEEEGIAHIDLSGRLSIPCPAVEEAEGAEVQENALTIDNLFAGTAETDLLGNKNAKVVSDVLSFANNVVKLNDEGKYEAIIPLSSTNPKKITGTLYFATAMDDIKEDNLNITLAQVGKPSDTVTIQLGSVEDAWKTAVKLGGAYTTANSATYFTDKNNVTTYYAAYAQGFGSMWNPTDYAFVDADGLFTVEGPAKVITAITRLEATEASEGVYSDADMNMKVSFTEVSSTVKSSNADADNAVYGTSVNFIDASDWTTEDVDGSNALTTDKPYNHTLYSFLKAGECFLADDGTVDADNDGETDPKDNFHDNVYVQDVYVEYDENEAFKRYVIKFSGAPKLYEDQYLVRVDAALNQEVGTMVPQYLEGYTYKNAAPQGTGMMAKLNWQKFILSALTDYKGIRIALLNKADIDYRYIVDTFESFVEAGCKNTLSFLAKEKQSAFAILNFPSVHTFVKCPYTSFTDSKGVFNVQYIVDGFNRKKGASVRFSLPSDAEGASFAAFYTPLKFTDGYVDDTVPAAGLVSNLFMEKYKSREPFYIIAGPNYGAISASGLVGPDYNYSQNELQIIEPFGVNCMIYRPTQGTFINANQTAKQTPVSALSKVNVRELVIYIQDEIEKVLEQYQWEFNTQTTRNAILNKANKICSRVAALGGIQNYLNVMDGSNNTPDVIDNEMAIISTHIEPGFGCGKMIQQLTLYRTGMMSSSILD